MIIFKLISTRIKKNLELGCSKFYFMGQNQKYIYIYNFCFLARSRGLFEPPMLAIEPSLDIANYLQHALSHYALRAPNNFC